MASQTIGNIKVVVNNQDTGPIKITQSNQFDSRIGTLSYGQPLELGNAIDLSIPISSNTGDAVVYNANTNTFEVQAVTATDVTHVYGGKF
jgi:hypothetical protein